MWSDFIGQEYQQAPALVRYPITADRGNFWLLAFASGPLHFSLDNLGYHGLLQVTHIDDQLNADVPSTRVILVKHNPDLKSFTQSDFAKRDYRRCQPSSR